MGTPEIQLWDYQAEHGEPKTPFQGFVCFREMTPRERSLQKVADMMGYAYATVCNWSAEYVWAQRAAAYDRHIDRIAQAARENDAKSRAELHLATSALMREVAHEALLKYASDIKAGLVKVSAQACARLVAEAVKIDRLTAGEVTERVGAEVDLSRLSDEDMAAADRIARKAAGLSE